MELKKPIASPEAEAGVIGSVLLDPSKLNGVTLTPDVFYDRRNALLWEAIGKLNAMGGWDALTLGESLKTSNALDAVGGYDRLMELQGGALVPEHSQHYAEIVAEKAELRRQLLIVTEATDKLYKGECVADEVISGMMATESEDTNTNDGIITGWEGALNGDAVGIPFPWDSMNTLTGGFTKGVHSVICGRSGAGKSMLLATLYNHLGTLEIPFLACPFEDRFVITKTRMAAALGRYSWGKIPRGEEWVHINNRWEKVKPTRAELDKAIACLKSIPPTTHFYDRRSTPDDLMGIATRYKAKYGIEAMFVDGAKDIKRPSGKYNDTGFDEEISQALCSIAERLNIAVISVFHLTKLPDNELITTNNIRGSGNIVSDARAVFAFQSKGLSDNGVMCEKDADGNQTTRTLDVIKSNHSAGGRVVLETDLAKCLMWKV